MNFDFSGQTAIVTGGTRGIGAAITDAFLKSGASVTATYKGSDDAAKAFSEARKDMRLDIARFDVSDPAQADAFFKKFDESHDSLDILVNNAGIRKDGAVGMMPFDDWQSVISSNLTGTYIMSKLAVARMIRKRFGRIVNISSPSGKFGFAGQANYAASKAGQVAFAKSLSKEVARRNITVNCVSPGFIDTDFIADLTDDLKKSYIDSIPLKRFGKPEDVASAVLFLCDKDASYISGTVLEVAGGL